jgi:ATP-dependent 26S proteasome regulatory subunit
LRQHGIFKHSSGKIFICTACNTGFKTKGNLDKHFKSKKHQKRQKIKELKERQISRNNEINVVQTNIEPPRKKAKLDNSSPATVATVTKTNEVSQSSTMPQNYEWLQYIAYLKYVCTVDTKDTNPNYFENYFWDCKAKKLVVECPDSAKQSRF